MVSVSSSSPVGAGVERLAVELDGHELQAARRSSTSGAASAASRFTVVVALHARGLGVEHEIELDFGNAIGGRAVFGKLDDARLGGFHVLHWSAKARERIARSRCPVETWFAKARG